MLDNVLELWLSMPIVYRFAMAVICYLAVHAGVLAWIPLKTRR